MVTPSNGGMRSWLPPSARCAAILVIAIGTNGLLGWVLDSKAMREFASSGVQIKSNTAIAILLSGISLWLLTGVCSNRWTRWVAGGAAALVLLIGGLTLAEHVTGWNFGIDELLFREPPGELATTSPNRPGPPASVSFVLAGFCLLLPRWRPRWTFLYQVLAIAVGLIASLSILGYAFGSTALYGLPKYTGIALHTSVALTILSVGLLLSRPQQGIAAIVFDEGVGGSVARRLLPPAILLPFVLGWLRIQGERWQAYDAAFGTGIVMLLLIVIFSGVVLVHAGALHRADHDRRRAEESMRKSQAILVRSQQVAKLGSWEWNVASDELVWSEEIYRIFDIAPGEFQPTYEAFLAAIGPENRELLQTAVEEAFAGRPYSAEFQVTHRDSSVHHILSQGEVDFDATGKPLRMFGTAMDVTARKAAEREREVAAGFLGLINANAGLPALIKAVTGFVREQSGCEAVGVRLKDGEDYPYYETHGFSQEFVRMENSLCVRDSNGAVQRDGVGNPAIACMCGNVICGRFDPAKPFFTAAGSFWTNNTTQLLTSTTEADRQARTRNRCNGQGYESVALIALRAGEERLGLLQLNDHRPDRFSPELIAFWERLGGYLAVAIARARAEEALHESEERFRTMANAMPQLAWIARPDGFIVWYNQRWYQYTATTPEQMEGWGWQSVHDPVELPQVLERWKASIATSEPFEMTFPLRGADGVFRLFLTRGFPLKGADGRVLQWFGTNTDVTALKQAEAALRESEERFRIIADGTPDHLLVQDRDLRYTLVVNPQLGLTAQDMLGKTDHDFLSKEDADELTRIKRQVLEGGQPLHVELPIVNRDGTTEFFEGDCVPKFDAAGQCDGLLGYFRNVTDRKQAEQELERMRNLLADGQRVAHVGSFEYVAATRTTVWSEEEYRIYGLDPAGPSPAYEVMLAQCIHPDDAALLHQTFSAAIQSNAGYELEHRIVRPDGSVRWVYDRALPYFDDSGKLLRYVGATLDITERKQAEEALRESQYLLAAALEIAQLSVWDYRRDTGVIEFDERSSEMFGTGDQRAMTIEEFLAFVHEEDRQCVAANIRGALDPAGDGLYDTEYRIVRPDGLQRWLTAQGHATFTSDGHGRRLVRAVGTVMDITARKQTEQRLARDLAALTQMHNLSLLALERGEVAPLLQEIMDTAVAILGADKGTLQLVDGDTLRIVAHHGHARPFLEFFAAAENVASVCGEATKRGERVVVDDVEQSALFAGTASLPVLRAAGVRSVQSTPLTTRDGTLLGILTTHWPAPYRPDEQDLWRLDLLVRQAADLIEREQAEEALKASLAEKEVLLKEIHHRVKNNMQVISSLVSLQADQLKDEAMRAVLQDVTYRVRSMALVHEKLYQSANMARVEFAEYTQSLLGYLWRAHGTAASGIRLVTDLEPVPLSVNAAVPCGLILNELATNAIKHAFRGRDGGTVNVFLRGEPKGQVCLRVCDNGTGLPPGLDWQRADSLGLSLVRILAKQLGAVVEVSSGAGTEFAVVFPEERT